MKILRYSTLALLVLNSGCASLAPVTTHKQLSAPGQYWMTYDSSRRGALLVMNAEGEIMSCAEPAPDTAYTISNAVKGGVVSGGTDADVDVSSAATVVALAGRSSIVLMARDAMFRLCEAHANGAIDSVQYALLYGKLLDKIEAIAKAQDSNSSATVATLMKMQ